MNAAVNDYSLHCGHMYSELKYMMIKGHVSMAVLSDGNPYQHLGIPEGLIFSFPVICSQGTWQIVEVSYDYTITASAAKRAPTRCALFEAVP
jgi:malate dehydrogenase